MPIVNHMSNEARVGIFIVLVVIIFFALSIKIGELSFSKKDTYPITMLFTSVEGLTKGSTVELAGVIVGSVTNISLNKDYTALVTIAIYEDIQLPINSTASIATKGVLGDKFIILSPGTSTNIIQPGGNLARTKVPPSVDDLLMQVGELTKNLTELSYSLNSVFGDEETLRSILVNIDEFSKNASGIVSENRENIFVILSRMKEISDNVSIISQNFATSSEGFGEIVNSINSGQGTMGKLVKDDDLYITMVELMDSMQKLTSKMQDDSTIGLLLSDNTLYYNLLGVTENMKLITDEIASGEGTLGRILVDDQLYNDLRETIKNANLAAQGLEEQVPITVMGTILGLVW